jgi:hypothetical protein
MAMDDDLRAADGTAEEAAIEAEFPRCGPKMHCALHCQVAKFISGVRMEIRLNDPQGVPWQLMINGSQVGHDERTFPLQPGPNTIYVKAIHTNVENPTKACWLVIRDGESSTSPVIYDEDLKCAANSAGAEVEAAYVVVSQH